MIPGIDVSHWQGVIDWPKVKAAGIRFAYLKATQGASYVDPQLTANLRGAMGVGIPVGLYHLFVANTGQSQLTNWQSIYRHFPSQLPAWLDIEVGVTEESAPEALELLQDGFSTSDCIYCSQYTASTGVFDPDFGSYNLAIAHHGVPEPAVTLPWSKWMFWQHSATGQVDGIGTPVDLDWFNGTEEEFQQLLSLKVT